MLVHTLLDMIQIMFSIILKQQPDGQIRVSSVRVEQELFDNDPFIKSKIKNQMERALEENHIKVLKDKGVVDID